MAEEEKFLTNGEAAKLLGIHRNTLMNWEKSGKLSPHHISAAGYKYYSWKQLQIFLPEDRKKELVDVLKTNASKKVNESQPLFRLYVDSSTGESSASYYAMRSGKTNSLAFVNNSKLFERMSETIDGQEILSDDDKYKFLEQMHNVTVTVEGRYLDGINATIAKCVFWIQLLFTNQLGCDHAPDDVVEKARYMKWRIDDYMRVCGLSDRKSAIDGMRKMLALLSHAEIQWQEEVIARDKDGKPIIIGNYKGKGGKFKPKLKKMSQTYRGVFISTRGLKPVAGGFDFWINKEFATYLAHAGVIAIHEGIFRLSSKHHPVAIALAAKLLEYNGMNKGKEQANVIGVSSLLTALTLIPKYETLTSKQVVRNSDGDSKEYEKHGNGGGWRVRIKKPLDDAFTNLVEYGIIDHWEYRDTQSIANYDDFIRQYICFELSWDATEKAKAYFQND